MAAAPRASRRRFVLAAGGIAVSVGAPRPATARQSARPPGEALRAAIAAVVGSAPVRAGRVELDLPPLIENGNGVPLTVTVASPMAPADHVRAIHVLNEKNPLPEVASFHLGPRAGRARISTRIRLADTQTVVAIAQMSDGSFWSGEAHVIVTLAACLEELPS